MKQQELSSPAWRTFTPPPLMMTIILAIYLALTVGLAALMAIPLIPPVIGLIGAVTLNLIVLFFVRSEVALPLYLIVAGPSVALSLSGSGILSRLYIGNMLFFLMALIWLLTKFLPERKSGRWLLTPSLLAPLLCLMIIGFISIVYSRLFPDPNVTYSFPNSNTSLLVVNAAEMMILVGLPMFLVVVPGLVLTKQQARWTLIAYMFTGSLYALGTIFATPLGLYSQEVILGVRRPQVFGSVSSALGTLIVLFACIAYCQALYSHTRQARVIWGTLTALMSVGVIMTFGRESWLALFLSLLTITVVYTRNWKILVAVLVPIIPLVLISGAANFFDPAQTYGVDRLIIWQDSITIWLHNPIMGIGAGNYQFFDIAYGREIVGIAHNQYLQVLAEMGVPGLICLLWAMGAVLWICIKSFRAAQTGLGKSIALAYIGYFVSIVFGGFFTSSFVPSAANGGGTAAFVEESYRWLLLGLVLSIPHWEKEETQTEVSSSGVNKKAVAVPSLEALPVSD